MTYTLRSHQEDAIDKLGESMRSGNRRIVFDAPTGFGKTLVGVDIIKRALAKKKRVMFIVNSIQLVDQTSKVFDKHKIEHGIMQGQHWRFRPEEPVQIVSAQTLKNRRLPATDLILWDECDVQYAFIIKLITETWDKMPVIGLTATPYAKGMGLVYHDLISVETTKSLIKKGFLSDYIAYGCTAPDLSKVKITAGDYNKKELAEASSSSEIIGDVVSTWLKLGKNRQTVSFTVNVAHSKAIVDEFMNNGIEAAHLDAKTGEEERQEIFKKHESGEIKILCNCGITTRGWDSPNTTCLILARAVKSISLFRQMVGRVLRIADNGDDAIILDHGDNISRLGFPDDDISRSLSMGEKKDKAGQKEEELEKELAAPKPCFKCNFLYTGLKCPNCGNEYFLSPDVIALEGELKELKRDRIKKKKKFSSPQERNKKTSKEDKQAFFSAALRHQDQRAYKDGWAANNYRERFGVWPNAMAKVSGPVTLEFNNFLTAKNIRYANRRR